MTYLPDGMTEALSWVLKTFPAFTPRRISSAGSSTGFLALGSLKATEEHLKVFNLLCTMTTQLTVENFHRIDEFTT